MKMNIEKSLKIINEELGDIRYDINIIRNDIKWIKWSMGGIIALSIIFLGKLFIIGL